MKYKILIILFISFILTFLIYYSSANNCHINYLSIGDGVASGETPYHIDGISYNNYILEEMNSIKIFNDYSFQNNNINKLITNIEKNIKFNNTYIKQLIHKANVITISIGMDEIVKYAITDEVNEEYLHSFIMQYETLIKQIRKINDNQIIIIGFYDNTFLNKSTVIILNAHLANLADKYNAVFLDINPIIKNENYFLKKESYYFNYLAHEKIAQIIKYSISTCENK